MAEHQRRQLQLAADDDADASGAPSAARGGSDDEEESEDGQRPVSPRVGTPSLRSDVSPVPLRRGRKSVRHVSVQQPL